MDPTDIRYILDDLACNASQELCRNFICFITSV